MHRRGFTMIELLMVVAVITVLVSMLTPAVTIARKAAATTATQSLLKRVSGGIDRFRDEIGTWPFQDHATGSYPEPNRLGYHLAHRLTPEERTDLAADRAVATGRYLPFSDGSQIIGVAQVDPRETNTQWRAAHAYLANRMARERAQVAILSGNTAIRGLRLPGGYDHSGSALVANPRSRGWAADYLAGELQAHEVVGDTIVDRWGTPLIYVCPVVAGTRAVLPNSPLGFPGTQNEMPRATVQPQHYGLHVQGRQAVSVLASDIRTTAAAPFAIGYELWSAGPDRRHDAQRDHAANRDDLAAGPYLRGLR